MAAEAVALSLLFQVQADAALAGLNRIDAAVDRLGANALVEAAKVRTAFSSLGGNMLNGVRTSFSGLGTEIKGGVQGLAEYAGNLSPIGGRLVAIGGAAGGAAALGVAALGAAMIAGAFAAGRMADAIDDTANSLSVSNGFLQIQSAAITRAGGDAAAFEKAMAKVNVKIGEAATGNKAAAAAFSAIGVSVTDANGKLKDNEVIFAESREALSKVTNESERAALANDIFGKGHKDMAGILKMSAAEYAALQKEVASYGVATDENIAKAGALGDGMDALGQAIQAGVINAFAPLAESMGNFAISLAPAVGKAFQMIGEVIDFLGGIVAILWDGLKGLWSIFGEGIKWIASIASPLGALGRQMQSTGGNARSLRDQFVDALQGMLRGAGSITGSIAAFFARMSARIQNSVADIKNGIVSMGLGGLFGLSGTAMKVDVNAAGEAARGRASGGFNDAATYVDRYRRQPGEAGDQRRDNGDSTGAGAGSDGGSKASKAKAAADAAAEAQKKYTTELERLKTATDEAAYSEEQKAIATALAAAGLPRIVDETNAHSRAIRDQVLALREAEAAARVEKTIGSLAQKTADAALSAEELAKVEARRAAGVSDNLAVTNEYIARLDAQAAATYRAAQAAVQASANEKVVLDLARAEREADWTLREQRGQQIQVAYEAEIASINETTEALRKRIIESTAEGELRDKQLAQLERITEAEKEAADARKEKAEADKTQDMVDTLADKMIDLFERPREAFAQLLKDVLLGFAKMAAANIFGGQGMTGGMGLGGMFKSVLGNVLGGGFGGFRAEGGSVKAGQGHIVGEQGREYFRPITDGEIIPAHALGGGSTTNTFEMPFTYVAAPGGNGANDMHEAQAMKRMIQGHIKTALKEAGIRT